VKIWGSAAEKREAGCRIDHTTVFRHPARDGNLLRSDRLQIKEKDRQPALFLFQHTKNNENPTA